MRVGDTVYVFDDSGALRDDAVAGTPEGQQLVDDFMDDLRKGYYKLIFYKRVKLSSSHVRMSAAKGRSLESSVKSAATLGLTSAVMSPSRRFRMHLPARSIEWPFPASCYHVNKLHYPLK